MNYYEEMKNYARYIDAGMKTLNECARTSNFQMISSNEDEKLMNDINDSISSIKNEIDKLSFQANRLNGLNNFVSSTAYSIQELKRLGISLGLQFGMQIQNDFPAQHLLEYNAPSNFQQQPQQQTEIRNDTAKNIPTQLNTNPPPNYYDYASKPMFRQITNEEYQTLPPIVPLLVKLEDMNKHYQNLMDNVNNETFTISSDDLTEIIQLSSSRINAFIRALVSLNRMKTIEEAEGTTYKML